MRRSTLNGILMAGTAVLVMALNSQTAYSGLTSNLDLFWQTIDGGGATFSVGGSFQMGGTIGQPDAGPSGGGGMTGGTFALTGGFWPGAVPGETCPADINGDLVVNAADLLAVINAWGPCPGCPADINGDNVVNAADLLAVINAWGSCP